MEYLQHMRRIPSKHPRVWLMPIYFSVFPLFLRRAGSGVKLIQLNCSTNTEWIYRWDIQSLTLITSLSPSGYRISTLNFSCVLFFPVSNAALAIFEGDALCYKTPRREYWVNIKFLLLWCLFVVPYCKCIFMKIKYEEAFVWHSEPRTSRFFNIGLTASWVFFFCTCAAGYI